MPIAYQALIDRVLREKRRYDEAISPPLGQSYDQVNERFRSLLQAECDRDYYEFCRITNGLDRNGLIVYAIAEPGQERATNVFDNNLDWRDTGRPQFLPASLPWIM